VQTHIIYIEVSYICTLVKYSYCQKTEKQRFGWSGRVLVGKWFYLQLCSAEIG